MDVGKVMRLNELWRPVYPYLAGWVGKWCSAEGGPLLEMGPFSGGMSEALKGPFPGIKSICVTPQDGLAGAIRDRFTQAFEMVVGDLESMPFQPVFELVFFRGAFFFLTPEIIREAYRVLAPGARALLGGGYGPLTPKREIEVIAEESKLLNYQLGKRWISGDQLAEMVRDSGMEGRSRILREGGLWLLMEKTP